VLIAITRVLLGLTIALFHAPLADFLRARDRALGAAFRERGVPFPDGLPEKTSHDLFFVFGIAIALFSLARIWFALR
jgi:hypothetical protein